jgi:hypothetical protein
VFGPLSDWLVQGRDDDTVIIYVSGHGLNEGRLSLAVAGTRSLSPIGTAVTLEDLVQNFFASGGSRLLLIVDACYAATGGMDAIRAAAETTGIRLTGAPGTGRRSPISFAVIREDELPSGNTQDAAAFRWALTTRLTSRYPRIRDLLRPLAYIEGAGLPAHRLWPALATAFAGSPTTEADLAAVTAGDAAGPYVVETLDTDGRSVYHPFKAGLTKPPSDATDRRVEGAACCRDTRRQARVAPRIEVVPGLLRPDHDDVPEPASHPRHECATDAPVRCLTVGGVGQLAVR